MLFGGDPFIYVINPKYKMKGMSSISWPESQNKQRNSLFEEKRSVGESRGVT